MKKIKSFLALALAAMTVFSVGCDGDEENGQNNNANGNNNLWVIPGTENLQYTDFMLAEDGQTDYTIVIPEKASEYEQFAAEELQLRFKEATKAVLPIETDEGKTFSETAKYISISDTAVWENSGVTVDYATYKNSGTRLVTKGSCLILTGGADEGALYSVYDLLTILFNYDFYDVDAYKLDKLEEVRLPKLDVSNIPDNDYRMYGDFLQEDTRGGSRFHAYRLRYKVYGQGFAISGHAATILLNPFEYGYKNPDWYSDDIPKPDENGNVAAAEVQLCYMNEGMRLEFLKKVKEKLREFPDATNIDVAQADYYEWCECDACMAEMVKYGNGKTDLGAITQILFLNWLVPEVDAWLAEEFPGRNVRFTVLAYHRTVDAPAHKDATGKYIPNGAENGDYSMVVNEKVDIQYASIYANRNKSFKDEETEAERLRAWAAVTKGLYIYEYGQDAKHLCLPYDGMHVIADNIRFSKELGYSSYYIQGNFNGEDSGFTQLRIYVASKLMWNSSLDPMALAYDYIENVYGEAAPLMKEYFEAQRTWLAHLRIESNYGGMCLDDNLKEKYFPRYLMVNYQNMFDEMYEEIDYLQYVDAERYEVLYRKIMIENMFIKYVNCSLYLSNLSTEEKTAEIDDFEANAIKYGFKNWSESKPMTEVISNWRNS